MCTLLAILKLGPVEEIMLKWYLFPALILGILVLAGCTTTADSAKPKALAGEQYETQQVWMGSRLITTVRVPVDE